MGHLRSSSVVALSSVITYSPTFAASLCALVDALGLPLFMLHDIDPMYNLSPCPPPEPTPTRSAPPLPRDHRALAVSVDIVIRSLYWSGFHRWLGIRRTRETAPAFCPTSSTLLPLVFGAACCAPGDCGSISNRATLSIVASADVVALYSIPGAAPHSRSFSCSLCTRCVLDFTAESVSQRWREQCPSLPVAMCRTCVCTPRIAAWAGHQRLYMGARRYSSPE